MGTERVYAAPRTVSAMTGAASRFLAALRPEQRDKACFAFADEAHRREWSFLPQEARDGLPIGDMNEDQRKLAHELIVSGTSLQGYAKVVSIMALEHVVRAMTAASVPGLLPLFDPGRYCIAVFGRPGGDEPWGWRVDGHHVSLNYTISGGRLLAPTPCMLGARLATFGVLAPLADDEEAGYRFVWSLDEAQLREAVIYHRPPPDFATRMVPRIGDVERPDTVFVPEPDYTIDDTERDILSYIRGAPKGLPARKLTGGQAAELRRIVEGLAAGCPTRRPRPPCGTLSSTDWTTSASPGRAAPCPASGTTSASRGRSLLIEHDNTQGNGNHIHSVWRDRGNDFGDDLLAGHYQTEHRRPDYEVPAD